jgi:electron transport complex protein RnfA
MADAKVVSKYEISVTGDLSKDSPQTVRLVREDDADIPIAVKSIKADDSGQTIITVAEPINATDHLLLTAKNSGYSATIEPSIVSLMIAVAIGSALINNFVFTRYLGLCVFFGVSRKRETAIGMGVTFTIVGLLSGCLSWLLNEFALGPLKLGFLQIIAFIGIVASLVQATETIIKKINPILYKKFGIFLVLITTNCIILAIPLLNATAHTGFLESMSLAFGSSFGFALAMFLMSCAREKVDMSPVPAIFKGLPIAFILAGLFALSFLGFSGLKFM